jgi:hypothetical protein
MTSKSHVPGFTQLPWHHHLTQFVLSSPHPLSEYGALCDIELHTLRSCHFQATNALHALDQTIPSLHGKTLDHAREQRSSVQRLVDASYFLRPPIQRLPLDVIGVILRILCMDSVHFDPIYSKDGTRLWNGPWSLSHLCRTWRYAALESGALWANIKIESVLERESNGDLPITLPLKISWRSCQRHLPGRERWAFTSPSLSPKCVQSLRSKASGTGKCRASSAICSTVLNAL